MVFSTNKLTSGQSTGSTSSRQLANSPSHGCITPAQEESKIDNMQIKLSGQASCRQMFLQKQQTLSCNRGQKDRLNNTIPISETGLSCVVVNGIPIHMTHL